MFKLLMLLNTDSLSEKKIAQILKPVEMITLKRNWVLATNASFFAPFSLQPNVVDIGIFNYEFNK